LDIIAFGFGIFEIDLSAGEVRKGGLKIRLQEQPLQVLAVLLERPGEVVTREELRQRLWSKNTFVDFDHSLSTAINKLREALGDAADNPRYVETVPRRGYRFMASVEQLGGVERAEKDGAVLPTPVQRRTPRGSVSSSF
jgi:DNA-binding winged helix-turn-helix (wHTH) protein